MREEHRFALSNDFAIFAPQPAAPRRGWAAWLASSSWWYSWLAPSPATLGGLERMVRGQAQPFAARRSALSGERLRERWW